MFRSGRSIYGVYDVDSLEFMQLIFLVDIYRSEARHQAQLKKEEQFRQDKKETQAQFLRDEAQRLHEFNTTRQWDIMNRY